MIDVGPPIVLSKPAVIRSANGEVRLSIVRQFDALGFVPFGAFGFGTPDISTEGSAQDLTGQSTYTYPAIGIGTPNSWREVFVIFTATTTAQRAVTSVTVNGILCSLSTEYANANGIARVAWCREPSSNTTAAIVITLNGAAAKSAIAAVRVVNRRDPSLGQYQSAENLVSGTSSSISSVAIPAGGFLFAGHIATGASPAVSWSGGAVSGIFQTNNGATIAFARTALAGSATTPTITATSSTSSTQTLRCWSFY